MNDKFHFIMYKLSNYNIIISNKGYSYWFNSLTRKFFRITEALGRKLEKLLDDINNIKNTYPSFFSILENGGFIIPTEIDELSIIRQKNQEAIQSKNYYLMVLPTLNCNFKCWYCIQNHIPSIMSENVVANIKKHIDYLLERNEIELLHLDWFGGEPFMYFDKIIKPLTLYAKEKCENAGVQFFCGATTNGYFLTEDVVGQLDALKFLQFQITLDGQREEHDKVKYQKGCPSAFNHVLRNINNMLHASDSIILFLRINYEHNKITNDIVSQINEFITPDVRNRIKITPRKVWQETVDKDSFHNILELMDLFSANGYMVERWHPISSFIPCYANKKNYVAINFNGAVVKCTACDDLYSKEFPGILKDNGTIEWRDDFDKKYQCKSFENERCLNCKRLPVCMGLCPKDHILGHTYCKETMLDYRFEDSLINYIDHEYHGNNDAGGCDSSRGG